MSKNLNQLYNKRLKIITFYITFILFLSNLKIVDCQNPCSEASIKDTECFNNVLFFNNKKYKAGNFATNKNGDIIIEFSEDDGITSSRLFYGLTKDGEYFFSNQPSFTKEIDINIDEIYDDFCLYEGDCIYNSLNLFISLKNNPNKDNQYLFSINSYYSTVELFDINDNNKNNKYFVWNFNDFFKINEEDYNFLYDYVLYEVNKDNTYLIIIIPKIGIYDYMVDISFIKKFRFQSFDKRAYEEINSISYKKYLNGRIINTFFMDDYNTLVVLSCFEEKSEGNSGNTRPINVNRRVSGTISSSYSSSSSSQIYLKFNFTFYKYNLESIIYADGMIFNSIINDDYYFEICYLFIKSIYLGKKYAIFVYIIDGNYNIFFELIEMNYLIGIKRIETNKFERAELYDFDIYKTLNDFVKIDEKRVAFVYTTSFNTNNEDAPPNRRRNLENNIRLLVILLIDIIESSQNLDIREFSLSLDDIYPEMQISTHVYNGYLLFATTAISEEDYFQNSDNYFSLFMIFGYANGTDGNITIAQYLNDTNLLNSLTDNLKIDNNIFGYK